MKSPVGKSDKPSTHVVPIDKSSTRVAPEVCVQACVFCFVNSIYVRARMSVYEHALLSTDSHDCLFVFVFTQP